MWQWRGIDIVVWNVQHPMLRGFLWGLFAIGWLLVPVASLLINHFDLFGTRQVWLYLRGREYQALPFRDAVALQARAASALRRLDDRILGDADDDRRAFAVCRRADRLHGPGGAVRRARFDRPFRPTSTRIPPPGPDVHSTMENKSG